VRKYIPELHDFGKIITIRNLLNHTSGLRDQMYLLALSGRRWDDAITQQDALNLVWRQKELNFAPGDQYLHSNTGYMLLGLIVSRVSGMPLREFTEQRIFRPLGMRHTHFQDDYGVPISNRAYSYWTGPSEFSGAFAYKQEDKKYKYLALSSSVVGFTGLFTTVGDLAL
jgi:CubicO group peptidase (beta-lactamase class C family)